MKRRVFIVFFITLVTAPGAWSQVVSGIVNHYLKVDSVLTDRVRVENSGELTYFQPEDKVLLMQMTGANSSATTTSQGAIGNIYSCGMFEILQVEEVTGITEKYVTFTDDLDTIYNHGEKIQLIRILDGEKVTIGGTVTAGEWDGNTGGIVAIIGMDTIIQQADIDVTAKGFRGGQPDESDYPLADCHDAADNIINLPATTLGYAGYKGEGIIRVTWPYAKGAGNAINGGGGGQGLFAGGGGGSNFLDAGKGGQQSAICGGSGTKQAFGGESIVLANFYKKESTQIIMGGGGGSGTENRTLERYATAGGDGGGIILLITETFIGNSGTIKANGQNVTDIASASGGGGGGGGTVLLDVARYSGELSIEIRGGDGGHTLDNCTGAGGGGCGGVFWHSGSSLTSVSVSIDSSSGLIGQAISSCLPQYGESVNNGITRTSLVLPLNGFLFNTIQGKDTLCAGQIPRLLTGSNPKGGNGIYSIAWQQSHDSIVWDSVAGTRDYQPDALYQTTFFRRIVRSEGIIDESRPIKIWVWDAINNNTITGSDTLCNAATAKQITGTTSPALTGGNTSYAYQWLYSANGINWNTVSGATSAGYTPSGQQTATRQYRRFVTSAMVCTDSSNPIEIKVLPSITSNSFYTEDTLICQTLGPGPLNASTPLNGDGNFRYKWMQKPASGNWTEITPSNVPQYEPASLGETTLYRRIVYSGNDNACVDTSDIKTVNVLPFLTNNLISIDSLKWCAGDTLGEIQGQLPAGGATGSYSYQWQFKTSDGWDILSGANGRNLPPAVVEEETEYRRIVASGELQVTGQYACHDTSTAIKLTVIPYINNNLNLTDQTLCQHNTPLPFNPSEAVWGGNNVFTYQWLAREEGSADWNNASGESTSASYASGALEKTTYFVRKVTSDICDQSSEPVTVTVYPVITDNQIAESPIQYTCFNTGKQLNGPDYSGGKTGDYAFLWQQSPGGPAWAAASGETSNTLADFKSSALTDTMFFRRIIYSSASVKECSDTSEPVLIRINQLPSGDVITSLDSICGGETLYISFNVSGGHGPWDVTVEVPGIGPRTKSGVTATYDSIQVTFPDSQINYEISMDTIRDGNGCIANPSGYSNKADVIVYAFPEADAGSGGEVCSNQFSLAAATPLPSHIGQWSVPGGTFADPADPSTMVTIDEEHFEKNYFPYITWTVTNWHCPDSDSVLVIFDKQPTDIFAGDPQTLDFLYATQLEADPPELGTGTWKVMEGTGIISNDTLHNATITELTATNLIRWTIVNGVCPEIRDSVRITVNNLVPPKGFSPNDDGINDEFVIPTANAEKITIKIYNRTGILVFESEDYTQGDLWNGTAPNKIDLPEGTYFYVMDIWVTGKTKPVNFRTFVEILR